MSRARSLLAHRGPDDWGVLSDGPAGRRCERHLPTESDAHRILFLHLRLSILDLTPLGWQPMVSADGHSGIIFNGEIYNQADLRRELEALGRVFRSRSDTEVLLSAMDAWGVECLPRLVGMFAFAWIDFRREEVVLARDQFGIKPLYTVAAAGRLAFASEIPAVLALTQLPREADPRRLGEFLRFGISDHGAGTMFAGVEQLPAGHFRRINLARWMVDAPQPYWTARRRPASDLTLSQAAEAVRAEFLRSIRLHLQSDVPVGAALSGGIDSSAIVAGVRAVAGADADIHAFGFIPDAEEISEASWIKLASAGSRATLHEVRPVAAELARDLAAVIRSQGEPFGSPSIYAQYRVFRAASDEGIKVMLNGQGADELLAGYRPHIGARIAGLFRGGHPGRAVRLLRRAGTLPGTSARSLAMLAADFLTPAVLQGSMRRLTNRELVPGWMDAKWFEDRFALPQSPRRTSDRDVFWAEMERVLCETSLPHLLRYDDRNSMAVSVESRVPFLTVPMLDVCWSVREEYLVDGEGTSKRVFREAMRGLVPAEILARRDKIGFVTPVAKWMATEKKWMDGLLRYAEEEAVPGVNVSEVRRAWSSSSENNAARIGGQLWRCLSYIEWVRQFEVGDSGK